MYFNIELLSDFVHFHFRHQFRDAAITFMHYVAGGKEKDPSWMLILPLVHFLTGLNAPFDLPTTEVGHDKSEPTWWGKRCPSFQENDKLLTEAFRKFKRNRSKWKV